MSSHISIPGYPMPRPAISRRPRFVVVPADDTGRPFTKAEKDKLGGVEAGAKDNVVEAANASAFPAVGEPGKLYVDKSENTVYRWDGARYVSVDKQEPSDYDQVKAQVRDNTTAIAGIDGKIPNQASAQNQLADKEFVNSSIATNTATFRGTYNLVADLSLATNATHEQVAAAIKTKLAALSITPENNDYCFVQVPKTDAEPAIIVRVDRYKCTVEDSITSWDYEWSLNNSSFTADQWAAINSGITGTLVKKLKDIEANAQANVIETVKVNGVPLTPDVDKAVNVLALTQHQSLAAYVNGGSYDSNAKKILLKHDSTTIAEIDATAFIKDGMVSNVAISNGKLVITFNTDAGRQPIEIPLTDIFNPENYYTKTATDTLLAAKQDTISDLAAIRSGAGAGATAYQKPQAGIPASDMTQAVQDSLGKADTAVQKAGDTMTGGLTVPNLTVGGRAPGSTIGDISTAEGVQTTASGYCSHAEGLQTTASGNLSHAEGKGTQALNEAEHAEGFYNASHKSGDIETLFSIGVGDNNSSRKNAVEVMKSGKAFLLGVGGYNGTNPNSGIFGATDLATVVNGKAPLASPAFTGTPTAPTPAANDNSTKVATTAFVNGEARYDMPAAVALVAENDAATLVCADRAVTNATIAAGFSTLNLTFPAAISNKVRDFYLRIVVAAGESAPALSIPQGITIENPDGAVPAIADGETSAASTTLVWFSETAPGVFMAKSETVKAVA